MAKRNKHDHKHWIPCRRSTQYVVGIDPIDKASDPLIIRVGGKLKTVVLVREDAHKMYLDYIDYWNKNMEQLFGVPQAST